MRKTAYFLKPNHMIFSLIYSKTGSFFTFLKYFPAGEFAFNTLIHLFSQNQWDQNKCKNLWLKRSFQGDLFKFSNQLRPPSWKINSQICNNFKYVKGCIGNLPNPHCSETLLQKRVKKSINCPKIIIGFLKLFNKISFS